MVGLSSAQRQIAVALVVLQLVLVLDDRLHYVFEIVDICTDVDIVNMFQIRSDLDLKDFSDLSYLSSLFLALSRTFDLSRYRLKLYEKSKGSLDVA